MLRIEKESNARTITLRLCGRIQSANIGEIQAQMDEGHVRLFMDLGEVTLVDVEVVRFLSESAKVKGSRLVAAGFGQFHPIATNHSREGRARNRRIEILLREVNP